MTDDTTPAKVRLTDGLGPLGVEHWTAAGEPYFGAARRDGEANQYGPWYSEEQVAAMVTAERERCAKLCEEIGDGHPEWISSVGAVCAREIRRA